MIAKAFATVGMLSAVVAGAVAGAPCAWADNKRFNDSVAASVYTVQHQAGCTNDVKLNRQLTAAAERHADDLMNNRSLDGDIGTDGSSVQRRAADAGYAGNVAETVAIHPAIAMSGVELMNLWYYDPNSYAIMVDCSHSQMGVWSENSLDRTVVVAVYGTPAAGPGASPSTAGGMDPSPDYDGSDEIEYFFNWLPWALRGSYPPPAYPPA